MSPANRKTAQASREAESEVRKINTGAKLISAPQTGTHASPLSSRGSKSPENGKKKQKTGSSKEMASVIKLRHLCRLSLQGQTSGEASVRPDRKIDLQP